MADLVSMGVQAAGSIVQGVGSYEAAKFQRRQALMAATAAEQQGADQEVQVRQAARAAIGGQVAAQGESGFQQGTGSALDALTESQVNATLDALTVRRNAAVQARQGRVQAAIAKAQGRNALMSGFLGAAGAAARSIDWAGGGSGPTLAASATAMPSLGVSLPGYTSGLPSMGATWGS